IYHALRELEASGQPGALATIIRARGSVPRHEGSKMLIYADGRILGTIGGGEMESRVMAEAKQAIADGRPRIMTYSLADPKSGDPGVCGGEVEIFVEPIVDTPTVIIFGAGHVGRAIAHLAKWLGFRVVVADDRAEYANEDWAPGADQYLAVSLSDIPQHMTIGPNTYIVLPTRNVMVDVNGLPPLLDTPAAYIGVIGSRRRWATAAAQLEARGVSKEKLARVHSPMGLELNAETPEEIAVSIVAEIIMIRNGGTGEAMRWTGLEGATAR
ncbi:MAG: XdhC family protein, partial [Chloroflexi bacterium]|nr:XdhC family protein [Chloroflexota bacterium]